MNFWSKIFDKTHKYGGMSGVKPDLTITGWIKTFFLYDKKGNYSFD